MTNWLLAQDHRAPADGEVSIHPADRQTWREHCDRFGLGPAARPDLAQVVQQIQLTGRGGGHFPAASKWQAALGAATASGTRPVVVANAAEGELASAKDAVLLQAHPHLVLDGIAAVAAALNASDAILWLHAGAKTTIAAVQQARAERRAQGVPEVALRVATGPDHYLTGESSAVINALSGGQALPTFSVHRATTSGVAGHPTVVHNVETLARAGFAARTGEEHYPGGSLLTVLSQGARVVTESVGETFEAALARAVPELFVGQGPAAVLLGGYGGTWMPWQALRTLPTEAVALRQAGLSLGAGVVIPIGSQVCGLATAASIAGYLAASGAGQCGPCVFGLPALEGALRDALAGKRGSVARIKQLIPQVEKRGGCGHPDGAVSMVRSALQTFAADLASHDQRRRCLGTGEAARLPGIAS